MISKKKETIILVNFWGLGDLIATFHLIKKNANNSYHIITPHNQNLVKDLMISLNIRPKVTISLNQDKLLLLLEILKYMILGRYIVFTSPLAEKSRKFAKILSYLSRKIYLAKEHGNIYDLNDLIDF